MKRMQYHLLFLFSNGWLTPSYTAQSFKKYPLTFDQRIKKLKTAHAKGLATWAILNLLIGGILIFTTSNQFFLHFHAMNASWGFVNTIVAAFLYFHHNSIFKHPLSVLRQMDLQRHSEKMMLLNVGLDIAFVALGVAFYFYSNNPDISFPLLWAGFGTSIMIQGAFLLILDLVFYQKHDLNRKKVYPIWKRMIEKP